MRLRPAAHSIRMRHTSSRGAIYDIVKKKITHPFDSQNRRERPSNARTYRNDFQTFNSRTIDFQKSLLSSVHNGDFSTLRARDADQKINIRRNTNTGH